MRLVKRDLLVLLLAVVVAIATWVGLNVGKMLYADWAFLHAVRINAERAAGQPPAPQPGK